jgi:two-component system response regulator YesN
MLTLRLERAKLLLLTTELRVYEVAERVGFEDVNYFSVRFKKMFGVSPKNYAANVRTSDD